MLHTRYRRMGGLEGGVGLGGWVTLLLHKVSLHRVNIPRGAVTWSAFLWGCIGGWENVVPIQVQTGKVSSHPSNTLSSVTTSSTD